MTHYHEPKTIQCSICSGCGYSVVYDPGHYYPDEIMPEDIKCDVCNGTGEVANPRLGRENNLQEQ